VIVEGVLKARPGAQVKAVPFGNAVEGQEPQNKPQPAGKQN